MTTDTKDPLTPEGVGLFFIRGNEILLMLRGPGCRNAVGIWALPGGMVETASGEDVGTCVLREAWEELGVTVLHWRALESTPGWESGPGGEGMMVHWILIDGWRGEPSIQESEKCSAIRWSTTDWIFGGETGSPAQEGEQVKWTPLNLWRRILATLHVFPEGKELTDEAFEVFLREASEEEEDEA